MGLRVVLYLTHVSHGESFEVEGLTPFALSMV